MVEVEQELMVESLDVLERTDNLLEVLILSSSVDGVVDLHPSSHPRTSRVSSRAHLLPPFPSVSERGTDHDSSYLLLIVRSYDSLLYSLSSTDGSIEGLSDTSQLKGDPERLAGPFRELNPTHSISLSIAPKNERS